MGEKKFINLSNNDNSYSTIKEDNINHSNRIYLNSTLINKNNKSPILEKLENSSENLDQAENSLINEKLKAFGYKPKMLALILSCLFINYISNFVL